MLNYTRKLINLAYIVVEVETMNNKKNYKHERDCVEASLRINSSPLFPTPQC